MSSIRETDKAIKNLMKWAERPEWAEQWEVVWDHHLGSICQHREETGDELMQKVADHGFGGMLFGVVFEDLVSRRFSLEPANIIDDYLKRRGWRESAVGRQYLQQLRDSVLSMYEVVEVVPGTHCDLRDLLCNAKTIRVFERLGTEEMVKWDRIAARVVTINGKRRLSGGMLPLVKESSQRILEVSDRGCADFDERIADSEEGDFIDKMLPEDLETMKLKAQTPMIVQAWLMDVLESLEPALPEVLNHDGEKVVFADTWFPVEAGADQDVVKRMDAEPSWVRVAGAELSWNWSSESAETDDGLSPDGSGRGGQLLLGTLELKPGKLILTTNSMQRTESAKEILATRLEGLLGPPMTKLRTPEQLMADGPPTSTASDITDDIDPAEAERLILDYMDTHYRRLIDQPIPVLGDKTPHQCAKSHDGKQMVIDWLKSLENHEARRAGAKGTAPYDFTWMWETLGLVPD